VQAVLQRKAVVLLQKMRKCRTYFLTFGFTYQLANAEERPQCVVCGEVLANGSSYARKLRRYLTRRHASPAEKPPEFFERKLLEMRKQLNVTKTAVTTSIKQQSLLP
jgi:hypothetical protein